MEIEDCQIQLIEGTGLLPYCQRLQRLRLTTLLERGVRGDLIKTFKIIKGFVDYGHNMFGTDSLSRRTRDLNVTSHHPLRLVHDFFSNRVIKYWNQLPLRVRIQQVSMPLRLALTSLSYLNLIRPMDSGNCGKKSCIE